MKHDPQPLTISTEAIDRRIHRSVIVGDSISEARAAYQAGTPIIALANKPNIFQSRTLYHHRRKHQSADSSPLSAPSAPSGVSRIW